MKKPKYPLEQVLDVKKDRVTKAQKVVLEKKRALEIEEEKLQKAQKERDLVLDHHKDKLQKLRGAMDSGTTSDEVLQMKSYLKVVKEKLQKENLKVEKQKEQVKTAQKNLDAALVDLNRKRIEEEKIKMHKDEWSKSMDRELLKYETKEEDELGSQIYEHKKRKGAK